MKNSLLKLSTAGLFSVLSSLAPALASAGVCVPAGSACVDSIDIINGQVTAPDIAVNAITGNNVLNNTLTEVDIGVLRRFVIAQGGGDFTTVNALLALLTPTAANPVYIDVMPGTYVGTIVMKDFVYLRGEGRGITILQAPAAGADVISMTGLNNVSISGFTIRGGNRGIFSSNSTANIYDNIISGNTFGILNETNTLSLINNNIIAGNAEGIRSTNSRPVITNNTLVQNGRGIVESASLSNISHNIINQYLEGIRISNGATPTILYNQITDPGTTAPVPIDIIVDAGTVPVISYNVFDSITGASGAGLYNTSSTGGVSIVP